MTRNYVAVQLPDPARRRLHAGPRRRRDRQPHRPGPVVVRRPRRLVQRQPRVDLRPAADDLGRGLRAASPSAPTCRTPSAARGRGTRPSSAPTATSRKTNDNNAIMAQLLMQGTELPELHRPLLLGRRRRARAVRRRRHRARRAAGGHRQHAAPAGLPRRLPASTSSTAASSKHAHEHPGRTSASSSLQPFRSPRSSACRTAASTSTRPAARTACASSTSPSSTTRASPSGSPPPRSRRWPAVLRADEVRHAPSPRRPRSPPIRRARTTRRTRSSRSTRSTATSTSPTSTRG